MSKNKRYYEDFISEQLPRNVSSQLGPGAYTFDTYCKMVSEDGCTGGQREMNALAQRFKFNIIIHRVDKPFSKMTFIEPFGSVPTVHLSWHTGGHYNSVRRISDPMEKG